MATTAFANHVEESLTFQSNRFRNWIDSVNDIMMDKLCQMSEHQRIPNLKKGRCFRYTKWNYYNCYFGAVNVHPRKYD